MFQLISFILGIIVGGIIVWLVLKLLVAKFSAAQEYKTQLLAQKSKLKELFDSVLAKSFRDEL